VNIHLRAEPCASAFYFAAEIPVPVVPDLPEQQVFCFEDLRQAARLLGKVELAVVILQQDRIDLLDDIDERPPVGRFWRLECGNIRVWFAHVAVRLAELLAVVGDKPKARFLPVRLPDASEYVSIRMASPTLFFER
jgi:hypothetical protein